MRNFTSIKPTTDKILLECGIDWCNKGYDDDDDDGDDDDEHNDDENDDVQEEEEDNDVEDDDVEVDDQSEDRDPHFVRACTIEMHMNVSQVTRALLCGTLQTKREPNSHGRLSANLRIRNAHMDM
jgi:hypothetical protein